MSKEPEVELINRFKSLIDTHINDYKQIKEEAVKGLKTLTSNISQKHTTPGKVKSFVILNSTVKVVIPLIEILEKSKETIDEVMEHMNE